MSSPPPPVPSAAPRLLTEVELELMTILWRLGEGTVSDVLAQLPAERQLAYTSVSTVLRILEKKEVLAARKQGRGHVYVPRFSKEEYEAFSLRDLITRVFDGAPGALVRRLVDTERLSADELKSLRALLKGSAGKAGR
jgi:predicted transcriptional regulator